MTMSVNGLLLMWVFLSMVRKLCLMNCLNSNEPKYGGNYDTGPYDSAQYFPVIAYNTTQEDGAFTAGSKKAYDASKNRVIIPGNQTANISCRS